MTRRFGTSFILAFALCGTMFILPHAVHAATAADGTVCSVITGADGSEDCIDSNLVSHGAPASTTPLDANTSKILGCSTTNTNIPSVGSLTAIGGPYVPVSDTAVTKNTGYLVYKACVLDALAARLKEAATAQITTETIKLVNTKDNGNPGFVWNVAVNRAGIESSTSAEFFNELGIAQSNNPSLVSTTVSKAVQAEVASQTPSYAASLSPTEQQAFLQDKDTSGWSDWFAMALNPNNNQLFQEVNLKAAHDAAVAQAVADNAQVLNWGNGFISPTVTQKIGSANVPIIVTPGYTMAQGLVQVLGSGFNQLENANSIDALIASTYSGLIPQSFSDPGGIAGLSQPTASADGTASGPSYLDQMFQSIINLIQQGSTASDTSTAPTSATAALTAAITTEQQYLAYRQQTQAAVAAKGQSLTDAQDSCWITLTGAVTALASTTSASFAVATSSVYAASSTADIIAPVQKILQEDIDHSTTTIAALQTMLVALTADDTAATEQTVLDSLDSLTANHTLHTADDLTVAAQAVTDTPATVGAKVDATIATWKQGTGWCNASSTPVVQSWLDQWKT